MERYWKMNFVVAELGFRYFVIMLLLVLILPNLNAQVYETNPDFLRTKNWAIGDSILLTFKPDTLVLNKSKIYSTEACAAFSNSFGQLLYYSDGVKLFDSSGAELTSIMGDKSSVQGVILFGSDSCLMISTTTDIGGNDGAWFYRYNTNNPFSIKLLSPVCEMQAVVKHQNQKNDWLILHKFLTDSVFIFPICNQIPVCPLVFRSGSTFGDKGYNAVGQLNVSPSAKYVALNHYLLKNDNLGNGESELYTFNNEEGSINFLFSTGKIRLPISSAFSKNEKQIFISERGGSLLNYQIDVVDEAQFRTSKKIIYRSPNFFTDNRLQTSPYGELFMNMGDSLYLSIIKESTVTKDSYYVVKNNYWLDGKKLSYGLPNFNASYFYTPSIDFAYTEDCWQHKYQFEGRDTIKAKTWKWVFAKGSYRDSILTKHCTFQFPDTGKWQVSHVATNGARTETVTKTLTIRTKWQKDVLGKDTFYCARRSPSEGEPTFKLVLRSPTNMHCVHWMGEEPNLDETLGPIVDYNHFHVDSMMVDTAGTYKVKLTNKTFCQMWDTITITEAQIPKKPNLSRNSSQLQSNITSYSYHWFFNGRFKTKTQTHGIVPDSNGFWQVQLVSEFGCESELSDSFNVNFVGINPLKIDNQSFTIYPNPSDGQITIAFEQPVSCTVEVFDMTGKRILKQNIQNKTKTSLHLKKAGSYVVKVVLEEGVVERIVEVL